MPNTINNNKDLVVKSIDLVTVSFLYIISTAEWDTEQASAYNTYGMLSWEDMYT